MESAQSTIWGTCWISKTWILAQSVEEEISLDQLSILGLSVNTRIGVHAWEQRISQRVSFDIHLPVEVKSYGDALSEVLDYDDVCSTVTDFVEHHSFQLIETLGERVALLIKEKYNVQSVTVSISKPHAVKNAGNVQFVLTR
jgi:dihydroneopterin aldolase